VERHGAGFLCGFENTGKKKLGHGTNFSDNG